jgi:hypothetical protein
MNDDELLNPLNGLQRAQPGPFLFTRIEARLANLAEQRLNARVSPATVRLALVGLAGLLLLNVLAWRSQSGAVDAPTENTYQLATANYRLY